MQHKGIQPRKVPASTNKLSNTIQSESTQGRMPSDEQIRISYGIITEVNHTNNTIRVKIFESNSRGGDFKLGASKRNRNGIFIPLVQPITDIHHRFGALRKDLIVEVRWRGKNKPSAEATAIVISDEIPEIFKSGQKDPESNEITTGPYKIFSGGQNTGF